MNRYPVKRGDVLPLTVERLALGGRGVARVEGYTVFVERGLPGQEVEATILRRKKAYAEARVERVLRPSPQETEPRCAHFGLCGGCALQHLEYGAQLEAKRDQVRDSLIRLGGFADPVVEETLPSPAAYEYRNKMEYSFSTRWLTDPDAAESGESRFGLGLHVRRRFDRVVSVERCHLQDAEGSELLGRVRSFAEASGIPFYSTRTHTGFWRFLVLRQGVHTGDRMVLLITNRATPGSAPWRAVEDLGRALAAGGIRITSLLHGMTASKGSVAFCEEVRTLAGEPVIRERLLDLTFEVGPNTFFQTNTRAAETLFREAIRMAEVTPADTVWDLYCGAGALSLPMARVAGSVLGIERVPEAIEAARRNAVLNGIDNATFLVGDVREALAAGDHPAPDVVTVDPPREGMHADVVASLLEAAPRRIVYVSCNPATLARDLALLAAGGYVPGPVRPVDLFPHTPHIECVTVLDRGV